MGQKSLDFFSNIQSLNYAFHLNDPYKEICKKISMTHLRLRLSSILPHLSLLGQPLHTRMLYILYIYYQMCPNFMLTCL